MPSPARSSRWCVVSDHFPPPARHSVPVGGDISVSALMRAHTPTPTPCAPVNGLFACRQKRSHLGWMSHRCLFDVPMSNMPFCPLHAPAYPPAPPYCVNERLSSCPVSLAVKAQVWCGECAFSSRSETPCLPFADSGKSAIDDLLAPPSRLYAPCQSLMPHL